MGSDDSVVYVYPTTEQFNRWDERKEHVGAESRSQFVCDMVEAGIKADKGFSTEVTPDESVQELRQQRNELKSELEHTRNRIERLEEQLHHGEREAIEQYVKEHPGATYDEIVRHLIDTVPERVNRYLDDMAGEVLQRDTESGEYYHSTVSAGGR